MPPVKREATKISTLTMPRKPEKSAPEAPDKIIALRCTASYRKRVEQAAKKEFRDSSGLIALALQKYFDEQGYESLPPRLGEPE
jgi:hypothetical protein